MCKIKMTLSEYPLAYITVTFKKTANGREATVTITQKQSPTTDIVSMTSSEFGIFLHKFELSQFERIISTGNLSTPTTTIPSYEMKLFKYDCGEFFSLEYRNHRVKIDRQLILALLHVEEKLHSFFTE